MDQINENEFKQLCRLLQIQTDVTINDLRKAYYRLAKYYHPDKNPKNELATTHFILVSRAYQTLCNELHHRNIKKRSLEVCKNYVLVLIFTGYIHEEQTSEQKHRDNTNQPTYTRSNFRMRQPHQQESETRVSSTNEKSIVSYCNDVNYLNSQNQSNLQHNKFNENCIIQSKDTDLNMMRCLICYRKFKIDVATKHVETCTRKGNGTNSLGSTTATGYSPISFRAKQYAEDLQKRTSIKPTMTSNNQSKNEIQRRKTETEIRM
ncbi:DNAj-related [Schistosoma mansoni]|uniref:DNAj-related n=1 Tax=Schistosoma mansoni TaxID=6183 RepID=UPI00022DC70B|nr:DNAj-related [Schistosoma mansoni]|eukprot:XP_018652637.1 DNAj-related [Schistosoma mansoni]